MFALLLPLMIMSDPVPIAGRPVDFSGAVGGPFVVTMAVDKTEVKLDEPIKLTITITGPGDLSKVKRPMIENDAEWNWRFIIDECTTDRDPTSGQLVFAYRLRAKRHDVHMTPRIRLVYFNPSIRPSIKGWQTTYSNDLMLTVTTSVAVNRPYVVSEINEWQTKARKRVLGPPTGFESFKIKLKQYLGHAELWEGNGTNSIMVALAVWSVPPIVCFAILIGRRHWSFFKRSRLPSTST